MHRACTLLVMHTFADTDTMQPHASKRDSVKGGMFWKDSITGMMAGEGADVGGFDSDDEGFVSDGSGETLVTELW